MAEGVYAAIGFRDLGRMIEYARGGLGHGPVRVTGVDVTEICEAFGLGAPTGPLRTWRG